MVTKTTTNPRLSRAQLSSLILVGLIILTPLSIYAERRLPEAWSERIVVPRFEEHIDRHTPKASSANVVPDEINTDVILADTNQPYLVNSLTTVAPTASLTIGPGVQVVFGEFAGLDIYGSFGTEGTVDQPVILTTNEKHPINQTWSGIMFRAGSVGDIAHTQIRHGVPGVSCLADSTVVIRESEISLTSTGVYTESERCFITDSIIRSVDVGIAARETDPQNNETTIYARRPQVVVVGN